ncbi:SHOCT domain-containing protein [Candidatus Bipolaricaulota bacterium]|nr:SHOCT domain-containing protein [Candidatus Bipolaricaulota bacterium]
MVDRSEHEIDIEASSSMQDKYSSLMKEARKQAREAAEGTSRSTQTKIWVEDGIIHWKVRRHREHPFGAIFNKDSYYDWTEGTIPLPEEPKEPEEDLSDKLEKICELHEKGDLTDEEFKKAKEKLLGQQ